MVALGVERFVIRMNNRKVLNGLLEKYDLMDKSTLVLRSLDKLPKIGREKVIAEMVSVAETTEDQANKILALAEIAGDWESVLQQLTELVAGSETGEQGVSQLRDVMSGALAAGVLPERLELDVSIARGLDYYTGTIVETFLGAVSYTHLTLPTICSV